MVNNQILLQGISLDQLTQKVTESVTSKLKEREQDTPKGEEYLTRTATAKLLSISLPTLHDWVKKHLLIAYRMGNRTYFKRSEIDAFFNKQSN